MIANTTKGFILQTGASTAGKIAPQALVTFDAPTRGDVIHACKGRQGVYFLSRNAVADGYQFSTHVLPLPDNKTDIKYDRANKQEYIWRSKEFVMAGRETFAAAKVVHEKGCVRLRLFVDGCCRYDEVVKGCAPFTLPAQIAGVKWQIELRGTARVTEVHIAGSMQELLREQ